MNIYLTLGTPGVELADISARFYVGLVRTDAAMTLDPIGTSGIEYRLHIDTVDIPGVPYAVTYEYPAGVVFVERWGVGEIPQYIISPVREDGATLGSLSAALYQDGVDVSSLLRLQPIGTDAGPADYALSGWPLITSSQFMLRWIDSTGTIRRQTWGGKATSSAGYYIEIDAIQSAPFSYGVDTKNRRMYTCNYSLRALHPVTDVETDIFMMLLSAHIISGGAFPTGDTYLGPNVDLPDTTQDNDIPLTLLINTGGRAPDESHTSKYLNLSLQVVTRALDSTVAMSRAWAIFNFLDGRRNTLAG